MKKKKKDPLNKRNNVFYSFVGMPNQWVTDEQIVVTSSYFDDKKYEDFYFDNFYDMDKIFGHEFSLFGTRGFPIGHPKRSSISFDSYFNMYGSSIVRVVKDEKKLQENRLKEDKQPKSAKRMEELELEVDKRNVINAMMQGAAKKGHYVFHMVEDELNSIDPRLLGLYGKLMSLADLNYWIIPASMLTGSIAGKEKIKWKKPEKEDED
tara:strand:- start:1223 stop:1846 length:624 start_codon:yes stop_codon:yes gene_type:complete